MAPSERGQRLRPHSASRRIAITGGPGAGKTTVVQAAVDRFGARLLPVSEVATLMFSHVFPKAHTDVQRCAIQHAIFHTQLAVEDFHDGGLGDNQVLLCDRGTPDGGGYWPTGARAFFDAMGTSHAHELARYEAVVFLESAAVGGLSIAAGNPIRSEDLPLATAIDRRLRDVWEAHPGFVFVPHQSSFQDKVSLALAALCPLIGS